MKTLPYATQPRHMGVGRFGRMLAGLAVCAVMTVPVGAQGTGKGQGGRPKENYDGRTAINQGPPRQPGSNQSQAVQRLLGSMPDLSVDYDKVTGATRSVYNRSGYLTRGDSSQDPVTVGMGFVYQNLDLMGLDAADMGDYTVRDRVHSATTGATHMYIDQWYDGLKVYNGQMQINVNRDGRIISVNSSFMPGIQGSENRSRGNPRLNAAKAVQAALKSVGVAGGPPGVISQDNGAEHLTQIDSTGISGEPIEARLAWLPVGDKQVRLVWNFQIDMPDGQDWYDFTVDAATGQVWTRFNWVASDSYRVYANPAESPNHTTPPPPSDGRVLVSNPANAAASPLGWHNTGSTTFTIPRGNNVHAYDDRDANNQPPSSQPNCGTGHNCDFSINLSGQPSTYTSAAVANLFYLNNIIHDVLYQYGFDEQGGNFQVNNFGNGGAGNDDVRAEAQDGGGTNNANFATPSDGGRPRMQMYEWTQTNPRRDGDLDAGIVFHEYSHGVSTRQVGGPGNSNCLNNAQQPGEGWSDWFGLMLTMRAGDQGTDGRGVGTYALGQSTTGTGIRTQRYSTSQSINNKTYASIQGMAIPHGVGEVWAQGIWEVAWALIDEYGFSSDLYNANGTAGNQRALLYVNEGLKNTSCSPTFLDARDGIIQAAMDNHGGEDVCLLWEAFAGFGLGTNASTPGPNSTSATNGFNVPASCNGEPPPPPPPSECPAGSINFSSFGLEAYSNQDASGSVTVEDSGDTLFMQGNRWRRSTQSYNVTPNTTIEFQYSSTSQGEIHGIGFDENQNLTDQDRIFQFWGTQNWSGGIPFTPQYSGGGSFQSFTIPAGNFYTGSSMRLVFVNDKDAGSLTNNGRFRCVRVFEDTGGGGSPTTIYSEDFDNGTADGWIKTSGATDLWRLDQSACQAAASGSWTLSFNRPSPNCDYDVGVADGTVTSPVVNASGFSSVTLQFAHIWQTESYAPGGFDVMTIQVSTNGGGSWATVKTIDASDPNPSGYVTENFAVTPTSQLQFRFIFDSVDGSFNNFLGWHIDNVVVTGQ